MIIQLFATDLSWGMGSNTTKSGLPWRPIVEDFEHFKTTSIEIKRLVAGSKTFAALMTYRKGELLPEREIVVLSGTLTERPHPDVPVFKSIKEIDLHYEGKDYAVIGGAETIKTFMPVTDRIILSVIHNIYHADVYLNPFLLRDFKLTEEKGIREKDEKGPMVTVQYYSRKS